VPEHVITITELIVAYLEHATTYYGGGSRGEYSNMLHALRPVRQMYGRTEAREFGPRQLRAVREKLVEAGNSRKYINAMVQRIVRAFRWGVSEGLIPPDVPQALSMLPGLRRGHTAAREGRKVRPVEDSLVDATLPHLPAVVRSMIELQRATGMRPGEVCVLRPCDVDRSGEIWEFRPVEHKNANREQDRIVYVGPKGQGILLPYLLRDSEAFCFSPSDSEAKRLAARHEARKTPLSCGNSIGTNRVRHMARRRAGDRYTPQSYNYAVRRACDRAFPVPEDIAEDPQAVKAWHADHRWSPNRLRHAMATKVRREFDIESAKVLLGHSQVNMSGHYAEQDRRRAIEVAKQIG
jgi:integrase